MITVVKRGLYQLVETQNDTKILMLDAKDIYVWVRTEEIGEILISSHKEHKADAVLCIGNYRLYDVKNEPKLSDQLHIELCVGLGMWQGYLLPKGLPTKEHIRHRIIPTTELITTLSQEAAPLTFLNRAR